MTPQTEPVDTGRPIIAFGDGCALRNDSTDPGPGGHAWTATLPDGRVMEYLRHDSAATNSTQEMKALLSFLEWVPPDQPATLYLDSEFVVKGCNEWLPKWIAKGWRKADGKPVANADLWKLIVPLLENRKVTVRWTKGHAGTDGNERADRLAYEAAHDPALINGTLRMEKAT